MQSNLNNKFYAEPQTCKLSHNWGLPPAWLRSLIVVLLILGIFFRFVNLDRKAYWLDEVFTSLRISGYTQAELVQQVFDGPEISVTALQKYQHPSPGKGLIDTINSLAVDSPQHPPLYFAMVRFWVEAFGNSVAVTRSLSALISLLTFPCIYWLCLELFNSSLTGWVAIALIAISPLHVLYAQEAREYSLWTVATLLSSAALLRAMRSKTQMSWGIYAATLVMGLYSYLFSVFVVIGHGIYVVVTERFRLSQTVISYFLALLVGLTAFAPWLVIIITNLNQIDTTTAWLTSSNSTHLAFVKEWAHNIKIAFYDLEISPYLTPVILILIGYSFYFLCRQTSKRVWLFILTLVGVIALALILPDLIWGGKRSLVPRYVIPCYLGIQLAVAYFFTAQIISNNFFQRKIWQGIMAVLISAGVVSCAISSQAQDPWNKYNSLENRQVAHIINRSARPLLLTDTFDSNNVVNVVCLSYLLDSKVRFLLVAQPNIPQVPYGFVDVFLYNASQGVSSSFDKQKYKIEHVYQFSSQWLWKLQKQ